MNTTRTDPLRRGSRIGVVAPGFAVRVEALHAGLARLRAMGWVPVPGAHLTEVHGYFAGADRDRAADLNRFLQDPTIDAIWFARGGYGAARILDAVDWRSARSRRRWMIGYSDNTALFLSGMARRASWSCLYGPVVTEIGDRGAWHGPTLRSALAGEPSEIRFPRREVITAGSAVGPLIGGNLTVLVHLLGSKDLPRLDGAILFLEEVGEEAYRIDRALHQLVRSGKLDRVAGFVLGSMVAPRTTREFPPDVRVRQVVRDLLGGLDVPVACGVRAGHVRGKRTLPLGARAELDTERGTVRVGLPG